MRLEKLACRDCILVLGDLAAGKRFGAEDG